MSSIRNVVTSETPVVSGLAMFVVGLTSVTGQMDIVLYRYTYYPK